MLFPRPYSLQEIATLLNARFDGDPSFIITGINEIHMVGPGDLTFVDHPKYYDKALNSRATTILINKEVPRPEGKALIISDDPFRDYVWLAKHFRPFESLQRLRQPECRDRRRNRNPAGCIYWQPCEDR